jgi:hypothetical protein
VAVDPNEYEVKVIEYYPAASDAHQRCPEAAAREREIASGESVERSPDVNYSDSSPQKRCLPGLLRRPIAEGSR